MNMYAKVLMSLLVTALVPLLVVTFVTWGSSRETLRAMASSTLEASALTVARSSVTLVESAAKEMEAWAGLETLQDVFTGDDIDLRMGLLLRDLQENSDFLELWCIDTNGKIVAASDFNRVGQQAADEPGVAAALAGQPSISGVGQHGDGPALSGPTVFMVYPLRGAFDDETLIGAIAGFYDWRRVDERVTFQEQIAPQEGMHLFLMDQEHRIVARGGAAQSVVDLLEAELPGLHRDNENRTHAMTGAPFESSRQLLAMASLPGEHAYFGYAGVAIAPEQVVLHPVQRLAWFTALVCVAAIAGTFMLALLLSRRISRPITALSNTARKIADGNLTVPPPAMVGGEIGQLAADLDVMRQSLKSQIDTLDTSVRDRTRRLEETVRLLQEEIAQKEAAQHEASVREQQLRQADKMVSLGILVSGVAHEINNPNGLIALNLQLLAETWGKALPVLEGYYEEHGDFSMGAMPFSEFREQMPVILADTAASSERIKAIVDDLKGFSRTSDERMDEAVDLNRVVDASLNLVANHLKKATRNLVVDLVPNLPPVPGNEHRLEQVVINLLLNACDALDSHEAEIRISSRHEKGNAVIEVADEGRGIEAADLPHVADPFFTTRRNAGGTGLGLSISAGIVEEHGGTLSFESTPGRGTTARIVLPLETDGGPT